MLKSNTSKDASGAKSASYKNTHDFDYPHEDIERVTGL